MAEAVVNTEVRSHVSRFYCHVCSEEVNHVLPEFICPRCECGFIEQVLRSPDETTSEESGDDIESLLQSLGGTIEDVATRTRWRRMQALDLSEHEEQASIDDQTATLVYRRPRREAARWRRDRARRMARIEHSDRESVTTDDEDFFEMRQNYSRNAANSHLFRQMTAVLAERGMENEAAHHFLLNLRGNPGDYAWGQEGLDAIITQLLNQTDTKGPPALTKEKIEEIPVVHIAQEQIDKAVQCSVCMEDFHLEEEVKELSCKHHFHINCIVPWLELHATCPICRTLLCDDTSYLSSSSASSTSTSSGSSSSEGRNSESRRDSERTSSTSSSVCDYGYSTSAYDFREDSD